MECGKLTNLQTSEASGAQSLHIVSLSISPIFRSDKTFEYPATVQFIAK